MANRRYAFSVPEQLEIVDSISKDKISSNVSFQDQTISNSACNYDNKETILSFINNKKKNE